MFRRSAIGGRPRSGGLVAPQFCRDRAAVPGPTTARSPWLRRKPLWSAGDPARGAGGFSLLEILVVLAIAGLISALLIGGSTALLRTVTEKDALNTALGAIASARHSAVLTGRTLDFRCDEKARVLDWGEGRVALTGEDIVRLLPPVRVTSILVGGRLVESPLVRVGFYADGTCDPFRLEIVRGSISQILTLDPWTCTVLAPEAGPGHR